MRLRTLLTLLIFVLIAGTILVTNTARTIALGAAPESRGQALAPEAPAVDLSKKNVLVLHAFPANMPASIKIDHGIRVTLETAGLGVEQQFFEYLDLARYPDHKHIQHFAELLRLRHAQRKIDFLLTVEPGALEFLLNEGRGLFPDVPVLALDLPPTFELPQTDRRVIQQSIAYDMVGTVEDALKLVPEAQRVYVVSGTLPDYKPYLDQARRDFRKWEGRLEFIYLNDRSLEDMLATVSSAPPGTIVLYLVVVTDITGKVYNPRDVVQLLSRASTAPVFGLYDTLLGYGVAGGSMVSFEQLGTQAAKLILEILANPQSRGAAKTFLKVPSEPMFDLRQLRHWKLNEDALPEGSIVINREPTIWDYKSYIIGGLAFILGQSSLIVGLLVQKRRRRSAEKELRQKSEELDNFFSTNLDLLCIADTDGYFLRLNPAWEKTLGYNLAELMSRRYVEFVHPDDVPATLDAMQALSSLQRVVNFTNRYRTKNGSYRHMLWSAVAVANRVFAAARDITERLQTEAIIHERESELQVLTGRLIRDQEEERRRVARELHDDLCQRLAALAIAAGRAQAVVQDGPDSVRNSLADIRDRTIQMAADAQNISRRLHPSILDDLGMTKAIEAECQQIAEREGIEMRSSVETLPKDLPKEIALSIYRIAQEGLNNVVKHACARRVTVSLTRSEIGLHLTVEDDGIGFDVAAVRDKAGLGLQSIRERVRLVRGTCRIHSEPEKGTTIEVSVPLKSEPLTDTSAIIS